MTPEEATKVLAKCAAYDPLFAKPNPAMPVAWAEGFSKHKLALRDVLSAVTVFYTERPEGSRNVCAALITEARKVRSDRADRETVEQIAERNALTDRQVLAKVAERQRELGIAPKRVADATDVPVKYTRPSQRARRL